MPCAVRMGERRYSGIVLNVSQGGLFVQTSADAARGASVALELSAPEQAEAIRVWARVIWRRLVPHQLRSVARGGVGLEIQHADELYYRLLASWMRVASGAAAGSALRAGGSPRNAPRRPRSETGLARYRVRVLSSSGPRSRTFVLSATSVEEARAEALLRAGPGWRVVEVESV